MSAPNFVRSTKRYQDLFRRWGAKANLRGIWDSVIPVIVVDRFRGPEEGSLRAITGESQGAPSEFPACTLTGLPDAEGRFRTEIVIHRMAAWKKNFSFVQPGPPVNTNSDVHLFTAVAPYDPVVNLNPVGGFESGMNLDPPFTRGTVRMLCGSNPAIPAQIGLMLTHFNAERSLTGGEPYPIDDDFNRTVDTPRRHETNWIDFNPPLRLPAGANLTIQWLNAATGTPAAQMGLRWTVLYHERGVSD